MSSQPHACTLSPDELPGRARRWRALDAHALRRHTEAGRVVTTYPDRPELAGELQALIAAEARCCSFLEFDVRHGDGQIVVELRHPPGVAAMLGAIVGDHPPA